MTLDRPATLAGFDGRLSSRGAHGGEWRSTLDPEVLVTLLQAAAAGDDVPLHDAGGTRRVRIRRCWYDAHEREVRAAFETASLAA